jgi:hypothetical protein
MNSFVLMFVIEALLMPLLVSGLEETSNGTVPCLDDSVISDAAVFWDVVGHQVEVISHQVINSPAVTFVHNWYFFGVVYAICLLVGSYNTYHFVLRLKRRLNVSKATVATAENVADNPGTAAASNPALNGLQTSARILEPYPWRLAAAFDILSIILTYYGRNGLVFLVVSALGYLFFAHVLPLCDYLVHGIFVLVAHLFASNYQVISGHIGLGFRRGGFVPVPAPRPEASPQAAVSAVAGGVGGSFVNIAASKISGNRMDEIPTTSGGFTPPPSIEPESKPLTSGWGKPTWAGDAPVPEKKELVKYYQKKYQQPKNKQKVHSDQGDSVDAPSSSTDFGRGTEETQKYFIRVAGKRFPVEVELGLEPGLQPVQGPDWGTETENEELPDLFGKRVLRESAVSTARDHDQETVQKFIEMITAKLATDVKSTSVPPKKVTKKESLPSSSSASVGGAPPAAHAVKRATFAFTSMLQGSLDEVRDKIAAALQERSSLRDATLIKRLDGIISSMRVVEKSFVQSGSTSDQKASIAKRPESQINGSNGSPVLKDYVAVLYLNGASVASVFSLDGFLAANRHVLGDIREGVLYYEDRAVEEAFYRINGEDFLLPKGFSVQDVIDDNVDLIVTNIRVSGIRSVKDSNTEVPVRGEFCFRYEPLLVKNFGGALNETIGGETGENGLWSYGLTSFPGSCGNLVCNKDGKILGVHAAGGGSQQNYFIAFPHHLPQFFRGPTAKSLPVTVRAKLTNAAC